MPEHTLEINGASIVLVGSFNPAIFQPEWFARNGLLPPGEIEDAKLSLVHPQVSQFETERFAFQITLDRFSVQGKPNATGGPLRDLVAGTFYILEHTPVTVMGLNRMMHFAMGSEDAWHKLGDKLAPKEAWREVLAHRPGLRSLDILSQEDPPNGQSMVVRVQPSLSIKWGVYFETNEQFPAPKERGLENMMETLQNRWEDSQRNGERIARYILNWAAA
jgi:hypothetical protein